MAGAGQPQYRHRWMVYMDLLGYRQMVEVAVQARGGVLGLIRKLRESLDDVVGLMESASSLPHNRDIETRILSDTVYITTAFTEPGAARALRSAAWVAMVLAREGLFVRGAIVPGGHYDDGRVLLSPALIAGYEMEKQALYPRIVLSNELVDTIVSGGWYRKNLDELALCDNDGCRYVHYLRVLNYVDSPSREAGRYLTKNLELHRDSIEERWKGAPRDEKTVGKYEWLAQYHNRFCIETLSAQEVKRLSVNLAAK